MSPQGGDPGEVALRASLPEAAQAESLRHPARVRVIAPRSVAPVARSAAPSLVPLLVPASIALGSALAGMLWRFLRREKPSAVVQFSITTVEIWRTPR